MQAAIDRAHSAALSHHLATQARAADASAQAYRQLRDEFLQAALAGPDTVVSTPGWGEHTATVADVIYDKCAGEGNKTLREALSILAGCANAEDPRALRFRAMALIAELSTGHAQFHCGDLVEQMGDGA